MAGYKPPDFNERAAAARAAKQKALNRLRDRPAPDPAVLAERKAEQERREAAAAQKREARRRELEEAKAAKKSGSKPEVAKSEPEAPQPTSPVRSEAELKAARDARYAARKARKK